MESLERAWFQPHLVRCMSIVLVGPGVRSGEGFSALALKFVINCALKSGLLNMILLRSLKAYSMLNHWGCTLSGSHKAPKHNSLALSA